MATTFVLSCTSSESSMTITVNDSLNPLPGSDDWKCAPADALGSDSGNVASWGTKTTYLHAGTAAPIVSLEGFGKSTKQGATGKGEKIDPDGSFPSGQFDWSCTSRS